MTPIKLSCDPPGDYEETGAIRGWGGDTAPAAVRWLDGDRLHLDSGGDILPDTKQRPGQQMRCGAQTCVTQHRRL